MLKEKLAAVLPVADCGRWYRAGHHPLLQQSEGTDNCFKRLSEHKYSFLAAATLWWVHTSIDMKIRALFLACSFAVVEVVFRGVTDSLERGTFLKDFPRCLFSGHTTWDQWAWNLLLAPITPELYFHYVPHTVLRVALAPLNVWTAELVMGYTLLWFFERRAWIYKGRWAFFHGNITLG